jgi:hypothetical protein
MAAAAPRSMRRAIGRGVPSARAPTSALPMAAQVNCSVPSNAEALPARPAWRDSAPTAAFGKTRPVQASARTAGMKTPHQPARPAEGGHREDQHRRARHAQRIGRHASRPEPPEQCRVELRGRDEARRAHREEQPEALRRHAEMLDVDGGRAADEREDGEHRGRAHQRVGEEAPFPPNLPEVAQQVDRRAPDALRRRQRLGQQRPGQQAGQGAIGRRHPEDGAPPSGTQQQPAKCRGEDRRRAHDEHQPRHQPGRREPVREVADHRPRDDGARRSRRRRRRSARPQGPSCRRRGRSRAKRGCRRRFPRSAAGAARTGRPACPARAARPRARRTRRRA